MSALKKYLQNLVTLWTQSVNTIFLFGTPDQAVSSRCYTNRHKPVWGVAYKILNRIFFFHDNHCRLSFLKDIQYAVHVDEIMMRELRRDLSEPDHISHVLSAEVYDAFKNI